MSVASQDEEALPSGEPSLDSRQALKGVGGQVTAIAFARDRRRLTALSGNGLIGLWAPGDQKTADEAPIWTGEGPIGRPALDPSGRYLAAATPDRSLIFDLDNRPFFKERPTPFKPDYAWLDLTLGNEAGWLAAAPNDSGDGFYLDLQQTRPPRLMPPPADADEANRPASVSDSNARVGSVVALDDGHRLAWGLRRF